MKITREIIILMLISLLLVAGFEPSFADDKRATKDECVAKTKSAAKFVKEAGIGAALEKINDRRGPFVWKDSYVFCFEDDTFKMTGHPFAGPMLGMNMKDYIDANGKPVFQEFAKIVKSKGQGWVDYMHARQPGDKPIKKVSFVMKVPDTNIIVGAGIYERPKK